MVMNWHLSIRDSFALKCLNKDMREKKRIGEIRWNEKGLLKKSVISTFNTGRLALALILLGHFCLSGVA